MWNLDLDPQVPNLLNHWFKIQLKSKDKALEIFMQ